MTTQSARYEAARRQVRNLKGFWIHLTAFVVANAAMAALNLSRTPDRLWFYWVTFGWGAGILLHALLVFGSGIAKNWEERKIQEILKRDEESEKNSG